MLLELRVENYAVIDRAVAEFGPGLNLLTGETGAGKSLLIDALALLLGEKASADVIRHGAEKAIISCIFEGTPGARAVLEANGIDPANSAEILVRREIAAGGKSRVFIDNQPATVNTLRQLAPELALIHSQSESLISFDAEQQRLLVDRFGNISGDEVAAAYAEWRTARSALTDLETGEQDRLRRQDMWSFQHREIYDAHLQPGEDESLETEKRVLANAEKIFAAASAANELLYESTGSAQEQLRAAERHIEELARYDPQFDEPLKQLQSARAVIEDAATLARHYAERVEASPDRLAEIEDRLALFDRLKRKYAQQGSLGALAEVIAFGEQAAQKLDEIENRDALLANLRAQVKSSAVTYARAAKSLTALRAAAAKKLAAAAEARIAKLAMQARFAITVTPHESDSEWTSSGWDTVESIIATVKDQPLRPLTAIASGGEMSRVLLALKVCVEAGANASRKRKTALPRTLVFDEIDIGIGGRAAEAVGHELKQLGRAQQVLCITHLPQIAAFADSHLVVERTSTGRAQTSIRKLTDAQRTEEIARMLSGSTLTDASRKHAREMIAASK
jgi:DNA repair protein RecN (Recombination protein N)